MEWYEGIAILVMVILLWRLVEAWCWQGICQAICEIHMEGRGKIDIGAILMMGIGMVFLGIGLCLDFVGVPAYYRRYIERERKNRGDFLWLPDNFDEIVEKLKTLELI